MSTRKLIIAALVCGLALLMASAVQFFLRHPLIPRHWTADHACGAGHGRSPGRLGSISSDPVSWRWFPRQRTLTSSIIGGGPGGYAAALYGAAAGLNIALVEKDKVGGTCLHRGCIPAKDLLETATVYRTVSGAKEFGVETGDPTVDFATTMARKQQVIDDAVQGPVGSAEEPQGHGRSRDRPTRRRSPRHRRPQRRAAPPSSTATP